MPISRLTAMLHSDPPPFPPTLLYNEGWLLRLVIDCFATYAIPGHPLSVPSAARWFSEALLPSPFLARYQGDPLAESWTHADGAIGHFGIGRETKTGLSLLPEAHHLAIIEAKLFSLLSSGITHAPYYDQAARTVACIAEVLRRADRHPADFSRMGFAVLAPQSQISAGIFDDPLNRDSIRRKVERRVAGYDGEKDRWYAEWFEPTLERIEIDVFSWEDLLGLIAAQDVPSADDLHEFYDRCIHHNRPPHAGARRVTPKS